MSQDFSTEPGATADEPTTPADALRQANPALAVYERMDADYARDRAADPQWAAHVDALDDRQFDEFRREYRKNYFVELAPSRAAENLPAKTRALRDRETETLWAQAKRGDGFNYYGVSDEQAKHLADLADEEADPRGEWFRGILARREAEAAVSGLTVDGVPVDVAMPPPVPEWALKQRQPPVQTEDTGWHPLDWLGDKVARTGRGLALAPGQVLEGAGRLLEHAGRKANDLMTPAQPQATAPAATPARAVPEAVQPFVDALQAGTLTIDGEPVGPRDDLPRGNPLKDVGAWWKGVVNQDLYPNHGGLIERTRDDDFSSKLADSVGSMAASVAAAPAGLPAMVATSAGLLADQGAEDAAQSLRLRADLTPAQKEAIVNESAAWTAPAAALDVLPLGRLLDVFGKVPAGQTLREVARQGVVKTAVKEGTKQAAWEGATEGAQQVWQNAVAQAQHDPERSLWSGVPEAVALGGVMGGALAAPMGGVQAGAAQSARAARLQALKAARAEGLVQEAATGPRYMLAYKHTDQNFKMKDGLDMKRPVAVVQGKKNTFKNAKESLEWAKANLHGKEFQNTETGYYFEVTTRMLKKSISSKGEPNEFVYAKMDAIKELPALIREAVHTGYLEDVQNERDLNEIKVLHAAYAHGGEIYRVRFVAKYFDEGKTTAKGNKALHGFRLEEMILEKENARQEVNPVGLEAANVSVETDRLAASVNIGQLLGFVNGENHYAIEGTSVPLEGDIRAMASHVVRGGGGTAPTPAPAPGGAPAGTPYVPIEATPRPVYPDTPLPKSDVPSIGEIRRYYKAAFDIPIRFGLGKHPRKGLLGFYDAGRETIHLRGSRYNDLKVVTHELGHALHALLYPLNAARRGGEWAFATQPAIANELEALCIRQFGQQAYPPAARVGEGFAEFLFLLHTDPARAVAECPQFDAELKARLDADPAVKKVLLNGIALAHKHMQASPIGRVQSAIFRGDWNVGIRRTIEQARVKFLRAWMDENAPIVEAEKKLVAQGLPQAQAQMQAQLANLRGAEGRVNMALSFENSNLEGDPVGPSLKAIFDGVGRENMGVFESYLAARRVIALHASGRTALPFSLADAQAIVAQYDRQFKAAARDVYAFQNQTLRLLVEGGVLSREAYRRIVSTSRDYVPFYRHIDDTVVDGPNGRTTKGGGVPLKGMSEKGSARELSGVINGIVKNAHDFRLVAERNAVLAQFVDEVQKTQGGGRVAEGILPQVKPVRLPKPQLIEALSRSPTVEAYAQSLSTNGQRVSAREVAADIVANNPALEVLYARQAHNDPQQGVFVVYQDGEAQAYQTDDPLLFEALLGMRGIWGEVMRTKTYQWVSWPTRFARAAFTSLSPNFATKNPVRDFQASLIYGTHGRKIAKNYPKAIWAAMTKNAVWREFMRQGGGMSSAVSVDRNTLDEALDRMDVARNEFWKYVNVPQLMLHGLQRLSETTENMTRIAQYLAANEGGMSPRDAANAARTVTLDFNRAGTIARMLNGVLPFFNAAMQDFSKMTMLKDRKVFAKALAICGTLELLCWWLGKDDEKVRDLPNWRKFGFYNFRVGDDFVFSLPKPQGVGWLFGVIGFSLDAIAEKDKGRIGTYFTHLWENLSPVSLPPPVKVAIETQANYSFFRHAPIETMAMERLPRELRAGARTSVLARDVSQSLAWTPDWVPSSPVKIDNAIQGLSGGLGRTLTNAYDWVRGTFSDAPVKPADGLSNVPGLGSFFPSRYEQPQSAQTFYAEADEASQIVATQRKAAQGDANAVQWLAKHPEKRTWANYTYARYNRTQRMLTQIKTRIDAATLNPKLSAQQKSDIILPLMEVRNEAVRRANELLSWKSWCVQQEPPRTKD